ncbi:MAG TPA: hypothetical protein VKP69_14240, partial [Isosphaeraceae bacterium]|nr:hypothetical protein [Isosphaeraceae bacterium]
VDACHPVRGLGLLYSCWLLVGQRFYVGVGDGRKRLNILGAYCPDDCTAPLANRQRIVQSGWCFFRHRITPLNVGRSRHFRRRFRAVPACIAGRERVDTGGR